MEAAELETSTVKAIEHDASHYAGELVLSGCVCDGVKVFVCNWCEAKVLFETAISREREACAKIADRNDQSQWGIALEIRKRAGSIEE